VAINISIGTVKAQEESSTGNATNVVIKLRGKYSSIGSMI